MADIEVLESISSAEIGYEFEAENGVWIVVRAGSPEVGIYECPRGCEYGEQCDAHEVGPLGYWMPSVTVGGHTFQVGILTR